MDKLVCILCRLPYKEPKMCNHCSEIFCTRCITPYLEQNHLCPKCHHILPELADCTRLIAEIKQHVRYSNRQQLKNCKLHKLPLKYFCEDCNKAICADCGIIDEQHKGHRIQVRDNNRSTFPKAKLREYLVSVEQCLLKDHSRHEQLVLEREVLRSELRWCRNKLKEYFQEMSERLEKEAEKMMTEICSDLEEKQYRLERLRKIKEDISQILQLGDISDEVLLDKISPQNEILEQLDSGGNDTLLKLQGIIEEYKDGTYFHFNRKSLNTLNQVYPEYVNHTYELDYEAHKRTEVKYSETFIIFGQEWRLKIYPTGNPDGQGCLSLFLELLHAPTSLASNCLEYYFRLQLISLNTAGKTISKEYRSPFMIGDCWGYNDFVNLSELPEYLNNGHLIFVVGIRNCSYYDVSQTMKRYIRKLQEEKKVLQELLGGQNLSVSDVELYSLQSGATSRVTERSVSNQN